MRAAAVVAAAKVLNPEDCPSLFFKAVEEVEHHCLHAKAMEIEQELAIKQTVTDGVKSSEKGLGVHGFSSEHRAHTVKTRFTCFVSTVKCQSSS